MLKPDLRDHQKMPLNYKLDLAIKRSIINFTILNKTLASEALAKYWTEVEESFNFWTII